ncbi:MAG TPA: hypothetical protein HA232_04355 [Methanocellales archaeon]|nr:hypothetical protein [Methanocellales archaeon]
MSGKMGSGAGLILEGIKRRGSKDDTVKETQVDVKNVEPQRVELKTDEVIPGEPNNVNVKQLMTDELINVNVLQEAVELALNKKQRISVWAPDIALIMWYLKLSTPMFSISDVAKKYITEGLMRDHPELYRRAQEELNKNH